MVNQKGMTLVELLVVVAVVGILAGLVVVSINPRSQMDEAAEARARSNVSGVAKAMVACITVNNGNEALCDTWAKLDSGDFVSSDIQPTSIVVGAGCVSEEEAEEETGPRYCVYRTTIGKVTCNEVSECL